MGTLKWDFSESWTTSLTAIGSFVGTIISAGLIHRPSNVGLSLFFGLLVLVAPILYRATGRYIIPHDKPNERELQGTVGAFFLTSLLILWSVFGQLVTLIAILNDLSASSQGFFSPLVHIIFLLVLVLALVGIAFYSFRTLPWVVEDQMRDASRGKAAMLADHPGELDVKIGIDEGRVRPSLSPWMML
jgi:hypothetical protein